MPVTKRHTRARRPAQNKKKRWPQTTQTIRTRTCIKRATGETMKKQARKQSNQPILEEEHLIVIYDIASLPSPIPINTDKRGASQSDLTEINKHQQILDMDISRNEDKQPSANSSVATERAQVPFLHRHILECDHRALEYTIEDHDITLRIPKGAVPKGKKLHIEIGVAAYGPFILPKDTQPISPIVWLCIQEKDLQLQKPFHLILPHYLTNKNICDHQVEFVKAIHNDYTTEEHQQGYKFHHCDSEPLFASSGDRSYGVLESTHCCYYCLNAKKTEELAKDAGYCLTRIERSLPSQPQRNEIYFSVTYFLNTCIKALKEQFPQTEGYRVSRSDRFKFKTAETTEISIKAERSHISQCTVGLEPSTAEIRRADIAFWKSSIEEMQLEHENKNYPPRIKMTVTFTDPHCPFILPVKVTGCSSTDQLDMDISFPLENSPATCGPELEHRSHTIYIKDTKPHLRDAFRELLPVASEWKAIGTLLGIESHVLDGIKQDEHEVNERLQKILSEWLKLVNPQPTWKHLIDAVEHINKQIAQNIRKQIAERVHTHA